LRVINNLHNGLVVGGGDDHNSSSRSSVTQWDGTTDVNWFGPQGFELPHVAAPAINIATAGFQDGDDGVISATSSAAPQVSGMAISLMEANPALVGYPEALLSGIMTGADENIDEAFGGTWPLNLGDSIDDSDGAGLVNAFNTMVILGSSAKVNGGNAAATWGHDYQTITKAGSPAGWYSEVWNASVPNNQTLRTTSVMMSTTTCGSPPSETNCSTYAFPPHEIWVYDGGTVVASSTNGYGNYEYAFKKNTSGVTKTYAIKIFITTWPTGVTSSYHAISFVSQ